MSVTDRIKNATDDLGGHTKEVAGKAFGNDQLTAEGRADQIKADLERARANVKAALTN